ncbi:PRC and DUF2382 domain-containing protein [Tsukamurella soli]|uniref:PRC and DUF2382 domain-containing protein n=1 Tax=Tsukamurella soli TaxID=644556 RepID=A0ABP8JHQ4_9ACTN
MTDARGLDIVARSIVFDRDGTKVGKVDQIYIDENTKSPTWVAVKTGWFGTATSLVPLAGAHREGDRITVAVTKDAVKDAPHLDTDGGITQAQYGELLRHYGLTPGRAGRDSRGTHADVPGTPAADGAAAGAPRTQSAPGHDATVVRSEERLDVATERVTSGRARLRKHVVTEQQTVTVPVTHEEVEVVREPISGERAPDGSLGDEVAEVTLHEDRVIADKKTVPVERVGLSVNEVADEKTVTDSVRKERVDTERVPVSGGSRTGGR